MSLHRNSRGLDLPLGSIPQQPIEPAPPPTRVGLVAADYRGLRPRMCVQPGAPVRIGQALLEDRGLPGLTLRAPATGVLEAVNRGGRRALVSIVIRVEDDGESAPIRELQDLLPRTDPSALTRAEVVRVLCESGLWTGLRTRPFGRVPSPNALEPPALFVTAMDSQPLAPDPAEMVRGREQAWRTGLACVAKLTRGPTYLCKRTGTTIDGAGVANVRVEQFDGPHPSGTVGFHIHTLAPVGRARTVWHIGVQDVLALGTLIETGCLDPRRIVALGGPQVLRPRLMRTRLGAELAGLCEGELREGPNRVISGSVLNGRTVHDSATEGYLARWHQQITVIPEQDARDLLGWARPDRTRFSLFAPLWSRLTQRRNARFTTSTHGALRNIIPVDVYERVMPMDVLPVPLLRALAMRDVEQAEQLGALELDDEDLALCTFVCPSKLDYGALLRDVLADLEQES